METTGLLVLSFFLTLLCGGIAAGIAHEKGHNALGWFILVVSE